MPGSFKITYSGTEIILSPLSATSPRFGIEHNLARNIMLNGTIRVHTNYVKQYFEFEVNNVSKSNADNINSWKENAYTCVLTPNTDDAGVTYNVKIINDDKPFSWMPNTTPDTKFAGVLMLRQI